VFLTSPARDRYVTGGSLPSIIAGSISRDSPVVAGFLFRIIAWSIGARILISSAWQPVHPEIHPHGQVMPAGMMLDLKRDRDHLWLSRWREKVAHAVGTFRSRAGARFVVVLCLTGFLSPSITGGFLWNGCSVTRGGDRNKRDAEPDL